MNTVKIRLYAAARSAVGQSELLVQSGTLEEILSAIAASRSQVSQVFAQCSFLVDGVAVHDDSEIIRDGSTVDVLPPFAGGC